MILVITYFEPFCQISYENFDWLTSYCDFVRGVPRNSKKKMFFQIFYLFIYLFFETTFFAKYFKHTLC